MTENIIGLAIAYVFKGQKIVNVVLSEKWLTISEIISTKNSSL